MIEKLKQSLELAYQPIVDVNGDIIKFEVLIRYDMDEVGKDPQQLITWAENDIDAMIQIDQLVFERFRKERPVLESMLITPVIVSLNVSPVTVGKHDRFMALVDTIVRREHHSLITIELEVLESWICPSTVNKYQDNLVSIRAAGIGLSLDDFGSGYACVRKLTNDPYTNIKLDGSLVSRVCDCQRTKKVVATVIELAHELGKTVTAEKVETSEQFAQLQILGCDYFQGYYFGKPVPLKDLTDIGGFEINKKNQIATTCHS
ncbi:MAG: EAL domain-containing protein [Pedobacter sp.]